jgi:hypothetical protein
LRVIPAEAFVVGEEIGLSPENVLRNDGTPAGCAEPIVVIAGKWRSGGIVVPRVCAKVIIEIICVSGAMPGIGATPGDDSNRKFTID